MASVCCKSMQNLRCHYQTVGNGSVVRCVTGRRHQTEQTRLYTIVQPGDFNVIPKQARVVIGGGGVIGTSVAYHFAERGWTDVILLEQGRYVHEYSCLY